ncbi:hypothetical protein C8R45DRAFT_921526 [Mycena sanguinolenta]|nr:hypothetical protein C8R45DRAFT_921526 [Mycena sanguinolenta]
MTTTNFTIDNVNPMIQYAPDGAWVTGSDSADPFGYLYSNNGTFVVSTTQGSSATFTFNEVFVKPFLSGPYSVTLDGTTDTFDGYSAISVWEPLFVSDVLQPSLHTLTLTNQMTNSSFPYLDLDYITWTTTIPAGEPQTLEDTDPLFSYSPSTAWTTDLATLQLSGFSNGNGHAAQKSGASVTVSFSYSVVKKSQGTFISIFGAIGPTFSPYSVRVDGVDAGTFNGTQEAYTPQVALYTTTGLAAGQHTLELKLQHSGLLAVDYVQVPISTLSVSSAPAASGSPSSSAARGSSVSGGSTSPTSSAARGSSVSGGSTSPTGSTTPRVASTVGPAVGGAVGGTVILAVFVVIVFFLFRRKRHLANQLPVALPDDQDSSEVPPVTPYTMGGAMSTRGSQVYDPMEPVSVTNPAFSDSRTQFADDGTGVRASMIMGEAGLVWQPSIPDSAAASLGADKRIGKMELPRPPNALGQEHVQGLPPPDYEQYQGA